MVGGNLEMLLQNNIRAWRQLVRCVCGRRASGAVKEEGESPSVKLGRAFQTLGLEQDRCTPQDVRKAYITLAKRHHPDSTTLEADTDKFILVRVLKTLWCEF